MTGVSVQICPLKRDHQHQSFNFAEDLGTALAKFADDMALVRVVDILKGRSGDRGGSAARVLDLLQGEAYTTFVRHLPVAEQALIDLRRELEPLDLRTATRAQGGSGARITSRDGVRAMVDLARLYGRLQRFAEAAIVLREALVSTFGITYTTATALPDPAEDGCQAERERVEKALGATSVRPPNVPPAVLPAPARPLPEELRKHADALRQNRNDIQHGSFRDSPAYASVLRNALWDRIRELAGFVADPQPPTEDG